MFSCKFGEMSKNTFFTEHLWTSASKSYGSYQVFSANALVCVLFHFIQIYYPLGFKKSVELSSLVVIAVKVFRRCCKKTF